MTLTSISNPLISSKQLLAHQQRKRPANLDLDLIIFQINLLTQSAGILLRLPQEVIATAIVLLQRYLTSDPTTNWLEDTSQSSSSPLPTFHPDSHLIKASSASTYLAAKQSFYPLSPRSIINVYALLTSLNPHDPLAIQSLLQHSPAPDPQSYYVSPGTHQIRLATLFTTESKILESLAFDTKVVTPYTLALTYLQSLSAATVSISMRVLSHLNAALLSPQLLYLTHQPGALAVAAIYLTARELGIALVDEEVPWWEVFDVGREELGFLVLSLGSLEGFVEVHSQRLYQSQDEHDDEEQDQRQSTN